ncbi:tyrosine-type recombinase/integrase [Cribrihabitans sp. XS_ASV171]
MPTLNAKKVSDIRVPGMYADGAGLYLNVADGGTKSWILRATVKGQQTGTGKPKRIEMGLGSTSSLSLAEARLLAQRCRSEARAGRDPKASRNHRETTFEEAARALHAKLAPTFRNEKHSAQWLSSLNNHAFPKIGSLGVEDIDRTTVLSVLAPIWVEMHPTAKRLKQRIEAVFDYAIGMGLRGAPNPVDGALRRALPRAAHKPKHHEALPWKDVPDFCRRLAEREAMAACCLHFVILTAVRSSEARLATWKEFDLENRVLRIPAERMKAKEEHRVPLSRQAVAILQEVRGLDADLVFPSPQKVARRKSKPLSINAFRPLFVRMCAEGLTAHGFRSTFRDWCAETGKDRQLAEAALAHKVGGVEGAYFRSDLFERRRDLMEAWGNFSEGEAERTLRILAS